MYTFSSHLCMFQWFYIGKSRLKKNNWWLKKIQKNPPQQKKMISFFAGRKREENNKKSKILIFYTFHFSWKSLIKWAAIHFWIKKVTRRKKENLTKREWKGNNHARSIVATCTQFRDFEHYELKMRGKCHLAELLRAGEFGFFLHSWEILIYGRPIKGNEKLWIFFSVLDHTTLSILRFGPQKKSIWYTYIIRCI